MIRRGGMREREREMRTEDRRGMEGRTEQKLKVSNSFGFFTYGMDGIGDK